MLGPPSYHLLPLLPSASSHWKTLSGWRRTPSPSTPGLGVWRIVPSWWVMQRATWPSAPVKVELKIPCHHSFFASIYKYIFIWISSTNKKKLGTIFRCGICVMFLTGIYFAAKSGRMCAETIVKNSQQGARMIDEADLMEHLREWDGNWLGTNVLFLLFCSWKVFFFTFLLDIFCVSLVRVRSRHPQI